MPLFGKYDTNTSPHSGRTRTNNTINEARTTWGRGERSGRLDRGEKESYHHKQTKDGFK
jgi:hypothetical protein